MNKFSHKLYILTEQDETYLSELKKHSLPDLEVTTNRSDATIVLASPPIIAKQLQDFPRIEWIQSAYAGIDALIIPTLRQDYLLTNVKGIFGQQISEYVLGYTISHFRHFDTYKQQQKNRAWTPHSYTSLQGKIMVVLGTGSIGSYLARTAQALGIKVYGINRTGIPSKDSPFTDVYHTQELSTAFKSADIVVNTLPATSETDQIINKESLNDCNNVLLFNVGRGNAVNEDDLLNALANGNVTHAFLDVFIDEPLRPAHPFWLNEKITITPHIAASSFPYQVVEQFKDNYLRWRDGFELHNLVDFNRGY
ncbi:D-2-hydroxyacid dehydrogenase [uncultured Vibrio sp.]|uniref:D-2-hydroxyacid dehydrogenase n=1 Tax=uncultured Vibrio sp. TaxID=114054 RepID=UPI00091B2958|nr:D-2-hydroxyacid dehydrogenase [uncultured Vibrio sp.]OIQ24540.1 MAG: D-2-hydroxyacid dehydrogenase [Vibrio sp. MedPE-SWchi]